MYVTKSAPDAFTFFQDATADVLHECIICCKDDVLERNMATCDAIYNYHKFCIDCIKRYVATKCIIYIYSYAANTGTRSEQG